MNKSNVFYLETNTFFKHPEQLIDYHIWSEKKTSLHYHDFYEVFIVTEGTVVHNIDGKNEVISKGEFRFIRPENIHSQYSMDQVQTKTLNISFSALLLEELYHLIGGKIGILLKNNYILKPYRLSDTEFSLILSLISQMHYSPDNSIMKYIILICANALPQLIQESKNPLPENITKIMELMSNPENFTYPVGKLCENVGYSQSMMDKCFQKYLGETMINFFTRQKISYACNQLKYSDSRIIDISNEIGFTSSSHFNHVFKKIKGLSPLKYRNKHISKTHTTEI